MIRNKQTLKNKIYVNQKLAASKIFNEWQKNKKKKIFLSAECQSGKTGVIEHLASFFLNSLGPKIDSSYNPFDSGETFSAFFFGPSDNELRDQTLRRFANSTVQWDGPSEHPVPFWRQLAVSPENWKSSYFHPGSNLSGKATQSISAKLADEKFNLFVVDESHLGVADDSVFDKLANECDLPFCSNSRETREMEMSILVSATPSPQFSGLGVEDVLEQWTIVHLEPGPGYYGAKDLLNHKIHFSSKITPRLMDSWKIFGQYQDDAHFLPAEFDKFVEEVVIPVQKSTPKGYLVIRLSSNPAYEKLISFLQLHPKTRSMLNGNLLSVEKFDSTSGGKEIRELSGYYDETGSRIPGVLDLPSKNLQICVIFGSLLQGKTINDLSNVVGWFDAVTNDAASNVTRWTQSMGRLFGYNRNHDFPVWSSTECCKKAKEYWDFMEQISNRTVTSGPMPVLTGTHVGKPIDIKRSTIRNRSIHDSELDAINALSKTERDAHKYTRIRCSNHHRVDIAKEYARGFCTMTQNKNILIFNFQNPPANKKFISSWNALPQGIKGKVVLADYVETIDQKIDNLSCYAAK